MKPVKKNAVLTALACSAVAVFSLLPVQAQTQPPAPSPQAQVPASPLPQRPVAPPPAPGVSFYGQSSPVAQGTVGQYLLNPHGEVDGLLFNDGTQVHFPPHMGDELVAAVKPQDKVTVQGYRHMGAAVVKAYIITNVSTGQTVVEHEPSFSHRPLPPHLRGMTLQELSAQGKVRVLLYAPRGELGGAVLEDGTIIRVPPHAGYQLAGLLQVGQPLSVVGYGTESQFGRVVEATAVGAPGGAMTPIYHPHRPPHRR